MVKPRWLLGDTKNQTHKNGQHLYTILDSITKGDLPDNLILLNGNLVLMQHFFAFHVDLHNQILLQ